MSRITIYISSDEGDRRELIVDQGQSLMRAAVGVGVDGIKADCGGMLVCATCHVYVAPSWVDRIPPPGSEELAMLEMTAAQRRPNSRLSCQILLSKDMNELEISLPQTQY